LHKRHFMCRHIVIPIAAYKNYFPIPSAVNWQAPENKHSSMAATLSSPTISMSILRIMKRSIASSKPRTEYVRR